MPSSRERIVRWSQAAAFTWALVAPALTWMACGADPAAPAEACALGGVAREDGACEPAPCGPGELTQANGACQPAGLPPDMPCPPGQLALEDGRCQPAGIPPDACGEGFEADDRGGCVARIPEEACPEGEMAVPGGAGICQPVAPCGEGTWGDIPREASTQFVDQAYSGSDSDGTAERPWTTIQQAIDAAEEGAIVAVAEGSYDEDVRIKDKVVRLWGRCPARVTIRGQGKELKAIQVEGAGANGTEIRSLAVTGTGTGIEVSGAQDVTVEHVWVHDMSGYGISAVTGKRPTSLVLRRSLVEKNHVVGVLVRGSKATLEGNVVRATQAGSGKARQRWGIGVVNDEMTLDRSDVTVRSCVIEQNGEAGVLVGGSDATIATCVIRDTRPGEDGTGGYGILVTRNLKTGQHATATVRDCVIERNHQFGVAVESADATIETSVIRATRPSPRGGGGWGIAVTTESTSERASANVHACLIEQNHEVGVFVLDSTAHIEASVIRGTQLSGDGQRGRGIDVEASLDTDEPASATVRSCVIEENREVGVFVSAADVEIESTVIRATRSDATGKLGRGIETQYDEDIDKRARLTLRASLLEENREVGALVAGSDATIESSVIRATQPNAEDEFGRGIEIDSMSGQRAVVTVRACAVEENHEAGVSIVGSDALIEATEVRATKVRSDESLGDGISVAEKGTATIRNAMISGNGRAGVASFGSEVQVLDTILTCNKYDLNSEDTDGDRASFKDTSGSSCTRRGAEDCSELDAPCTVMSSKVEAPPRVEPTLPTSLAE